jgi:hypothetical protein
MTTLLAQALLGIALLLMLGAVVELRTAWRFSRLRRGQVGDAGRVEIEGVVEDDGAVLEAPLTRQACVLFSLVLSRQRKDFSGRSALLFVEQRPFVVVVDARRLAVDPKRVVVTGLDATDTVLPFLPQGVLGLLVTRFGHMAQVWAEDYVLRGRESCLPVGSRVFALWQDGELRTVSTKPLREIAASARGRALQATGFAVPLAVIGLWLRTL